MENNKACIQIPAELAKFNAPNIMGSQKSLNFTFMSDMATIAQAIPPLLEPAFPMLSGYITYIDAPAFAEPYREAMLGAYVNYKGTIGLYPMMFLLSGPGAEQATLPGRERFGLPKKMCERTECICLERNGDVVRGTAERKGVMLLDVSLKIGEYNSPAAVNFYGQPAPGAKSGGMSFYTQPVIEPDGTGNDCFARVNLYSNIAEYTYKSWEPGTVVVRTESSRDDAWGAFPVFENIGGAYNENDLEMKDLYLLETGDAGECMPMLLTARYDRIGFMGVEK